MAELYLCAPDDYTYFLYLDKAVKYNLCEQSERDSGFDVYCSEDVEMTNGKTEFLSFGITAACAVKKYADDVIEPRAFWLIPRSSISKTPFICANSVGLIDSGYRGPLKGAIKMVNGTSGDASEKILCGTRLFQIVSGSAKPWKYIHVVRNIAEFPKPESRRGTGGFGSTGTS